MTARLLVTGARVLTPGGEWPRGWIAVEGRRIAAMGQGKPPPGTGAGADVLAADGLVAMPGFIDLHAHGAVGVDVLDAERAAVLGFDAVATGHHARIGSHDGRRTLQRGADRAKDQSYVVHMLGQTELARTLFPVGRFTDKAELRALAGSLGLRTATKPDSQDVCFVTSAAGREGFLGSRIPLRPGRVVDATGAEVGRVEAVELVTVGQRRGLGLAGGGAPRYAVDVDVASATVRRSSGVVRGVIRSTIVVTVATDSRIQPSKPGSTSPAMSWSTRVSAAPLCGRLSHGTSVSGPASARRRAASPASSRAGVVRTGASRSLRSAAMSSRTSGRSRSRPPSSW